MSWALDTAVNQADKDPCPCEPCILEGRQTTKKYIS